MPTESEKYKNHSMIKKNVLHFLIFSFMAILLKELSKSLNETVGTN